MGDGAGGADVKLGESAESEIGGCESEETGRVSGESGRDGIAPPGSRREKLGRGCMGPPSAAAPSARARGYTSGLRHSWERDVSQGE